MDLGLPVLLIVGGLVTALGVYLATRDTAPSTNSETKNHIRPSCACRRPSATNLRPGNNRSQVFFFTQAGLHSRQG
jgi:hypothetical protein